MNRRKFLGLFGAGAVAAPVVAKSTRKPKAGEFNIYNESKVGPLGLNKLDLKEILMAENYPPNGNIEEWYAECLIKGLRENIK